jgi:hypothetical protein
MSDYLLIKLGDGLYCVMALDIIYKFINGVEDTLRRAIQKVQPVSPA